MNDSTESVNPAPHRVQLRRTKGWRKPDNTVVVARPSRWGNPWQIETNGHCRTCKCSPAYSYTVVHAEQRSSLGTFGTLDPDGVPGTGARYWAVQGYRWHLGENPDLRAAVADLRGKNLACWCPLDSPCHADVLLELANREVE